MTVIELGDVTLGSRPPGAAEPPEDDRRAVRRFALAAVAVLCLGTVTGSVRPEPALLRTLWSIPFGLADRYAMTSDALYAATSASRSRLTAYDLRTGAVRWSAAMPEPNGWPLTAEAAGVLLLPADRTTKQVASPTSGSYLAEFYRQTVAVDAHTGAELWRVPGDAFAVSGRSVLLVDRGGDRGDALLAFRLVDLPGGDVRWSRTTAADTVQVALGGADQLNPDLLATVTATGQAEVLRLADGASMSAGHVDYRGGSPEDGEYVDMFLDARNLYLRLAGGRGDSLTAYALGTLRQVWRRGDTARVTAYPCGAVLCSLTNPGMATFDPATGRELWSDPRTQSAWPAGPGRLLSTDRGPEEYTLVDEATGRRIARLAGGQPIPDTAGTVVYLVRDTHDPRYRTAVSRIDLASGRLGLRGTIPRIGGDFGCTATADRLACPTVSGRLVVAEVG